MSSKRPLFKPLFIALSLVMGLPLATRSAWLYFGPPYLATNTHPQAEFTRLDLSLQKEGSAAFEFYLHLNQLGLDRSFAVQKLASFFVEPNREKYADCFLKLARANLQDGELATHALLRAIRLSHGESGEDAVELYVKDFSDSPQATQLPLALNDYNREFARKLLLRMNTNTHSSKVRAIILVTLGSLCKADSRNLEAVAFFDKAAHELSGLDTFELRKQRQRLELDLAELREQGISALSPDIVGQIQNGTLVRLSDFKKKVICLDFWGDW